MTSLLDFEQLIYEVRHMTPRQRLYRILKTELTRLNHWKNKPRRARKTAT